MADKTKVNLTEAKGRPMLHWVGPRRIHSLMALWDGKFFIHQPAQAQVNITRQDQNILVEIEDFISPTIVERLEMDTPLFKAQIPDWRAMVDVVLIDTEHFEGDGVHGPGCFGHSLALASYWRRSLYPG